MGCCSGDMNFMRQTLTHLISPEIENMIGEKEKLIKFSSLKVKLIESKLKINSFEGMLSSPQLRKCLSDLKFDIKVNKSISTRSKQILTQERDTEKGFIDPDANASVTLQMPARVDHTSSCLLADSAFSAS